jgi:hypothetical protein
MYFRGDTHPADLGRVYDRCRPCCVEGSCDFFCGFAFDAVELSLGRLERARDFESCDVRSSSSSSSSLLLLLFCSTTILSPLMASTRSLSSASAACASQFFTSGADRLLSLLPQMLLRSGSAPCWAGGGGLKLSRLIFEGVAAALCMHRAHVAGGWVHAR